MKKYDDHRAALNGAVLNRTLEEKTTLALISIAQSFIDVAETLDRIAEKLPKQQ
jgi:hypothetical protein